MDKQKEQPNKSKQQIERASFTTEATAFLSGLFREFQQQTRKYQQLTFQCLSLEAQLELTEKTLCLTRDHLAMTIEKTDNALPHDWENALQKVRFVGVRLADACRKLLQEQGKMNPEQLLEGLNEGMFRFRTNSPLREIHAALLRQTFAKKTGPSYVWIGDPDEQISLRLRVVNPAASVQGGVKEGTTNTSQK
ncbi:MAG: hypothetical protein ACYDDI_17515 [Candidatus Acidiferrales bacterium]